MKKFGKRFASLFLCLMLLISLCACKKKDPPTLTMFVGLGMTNTGYYSALHDLLLEKVGIDLQYVYFTTGDTTNQVRDMLTNGDVPADLVATASPSSPEQQQTCFLDLASYTNVPNLFSIVTLQGFDVDGAVYQLPFASRLIGIEYNKTLMEEQGWSLPDTMDDMLELKELAEAAGYKFAVSGGVATGHGMNYLLNVMGSQYLSTPEGREWLSSFQTGTASVDAFAEQAAYFEDYVNAGLMGHMHTTDWSAKQECGRERALFYYNVINDLSSYDGYRYLPDGTLYGAAYGEDGMPVAKESETGEAVLLNGAYVLYDAANEAHQGLTRYTIPGAQVLHDTYGSMPWVSKEGTANCFIMYNNMYLGVSKALGEKGNAEKLAMAVKVLEFMTTDDATQLLTSILTDGYVGVKGFTPSSDRMYSAYADRISAGYLMPWFYNEFDADSVASVGGKVNEYIVGETGVTLDDIMDALVLYNEKHLNGTADSAGTASETLGYRDNAMLQAAVNGQSLQSVLDAAGESAEITVSLLPYMEKAGDISAEKNLPLVQAKIYAGEIPSGTLNMYVNGGCQSPVAIRMTGEEISQLASGGYSSLADKGYDRIFPYVTVVKGNAKLKNDQEYWVAVPSAALEQTVYARFCDEGRVLLNGDGKPYTGNLLDGLRSYLSRYQTVSPGSIIWD